MVLAEEMSIGERFLDVSKGLSGETISSLIIIGIIILLSFYISIRAHFADPLKKPKGILLLAEIGITFFDDMVANMMGRRYKGFGGFILAIAVYLFLAFIFGLTGLPSPVTYLATPLSLGLITFTLIHANAVRFNKFKYFKRFVDPIPVLLPVNLLSMWAPLLSLTLRLFGNALAGWTIMTLLYTALESVSASIFSNIPGGFGGAILPPFVTPVLHAYFDLFSGLIQTTVFLFLTMILIANEGPEEDELDASLQKGGN